MATLDLSHATASVSMMSPDLTGFSSADLTFPGNWSFFTPTGNYIHLAGAGMTYDAGGHALTGTVSSISIDIGNNSLLDPDVRITGLNAAAATLDDGADSFWRVLEGNDMITGGLAAAAGPNAEFDIFGDGLAGRGGKTGGDDDIDTGDTRARISGDVMEVGSPASGDAGTLYRGGADFIDGRITAQAQALYGDAYIVSGSGRLAGGADSIINGSTSSDSFVAGDAGLTTDDGKIIGGHDDIDAAGFGFGGVLVGDVGSQGLFTFVRGGDDNIRDSERANILVGDVQYAPGTMVGGNDTIFGNGGADSIYGDVFDTRGGKITGGDDIIYGGEGADTIFGEKGDGKPAALTGGADRLFGETGDDLIFGQTGNDRLDGGADADTLDGGDGGDRLTGGDGADDFVFTFGSDKDRVSDFEDGVDELDLSAFGFRSFKDVKALASDTRGGDLWLEFGDGDATLIENFAKADPSRDDLIL